MFKTKNISKCMSVLKKGLTKFFPYFLIRLVWSLTKGFHQKLQPIFKNNSSIVWSTQQLERREKRGFSAWISSDLLELISSGGRRKSAPPSRLLRLWFTALNTAVYLWKTALYDKFLNHSLALYVTEESEPPSWGVKESRMDESFVELVTKGGSTRGKGNRTEDFKTEVKLSADEGGST